MEYTKHLLYQMQILDCTKLAILSHSCYMLPHGEINSLKHVRGVGLFDMFLAPTFCRLTPLKDCGWLKPVPVTLHFRLSSAGGWISTSYSRSCVSHYAAVPHKKEHYCTLDVWSIYGLIIHESWKQFLCFCKKVDSFSD